MSIVSVIIVNYNAGSILQQTVLPLLSSSAVDEIFVIDNGSMDHSMDAIERLVGSQSRLHCIKNGENIGFARACNMAISLTRGTDYLLFLNPDCIIDNSALEIMLSCMKSFPRAGIAGPLLLNMDGSEQAGGGVPCQRRGDLLSVLLACPSLVIDTPNSSRISCFINNQYLLGP